MFANPDIPVDMTGADLSRDPYLGSAQGKGLRVRFYWENVTLKTLDAEKNGKIVTRLVVMKKPLGDKYTEVPEVIDPKEAAKRYPREWAAFSQYEDVPTYGTPLTELPGATQSSIAIMNLHGLTSIEDLREIGEDQAAQIGIEATRLRKLALAWLDRKEGNADAIDFSERLATIERMLKSKDEANARLERRNIELEAALKAVRGQGAPAVQSVLQPEAVESGETYAIDDNDGFMGMGGMANDRPDPLDLDPLADDD